MNLDQISEVEVDWERQVYMGGMGVARIFQRGGHIDSYIGYSPNCHLNIVGCLLTKRLTKGGSRAPQDPPWLRPWEDTCDDIGGEAPLESLTGTFFSFR